MERIIVERELDEPTSFATFQGIKERGAWCLDLYRVRYLGGYLSPDGRRLICNYEAPDAESVRAPSRRLGVAFDSVWSATVLEGHGPVGHLAPLGLPRTDQRGPATQISVSARNPAGEKEFVIAERRFDTPIEFQEIQQMEQISRPCFEMHNTALLRSYLSNDRRRMICVFHAPDAESVRIANRQAGAPTERVWKASVYEVPAEQ